MVILVDTNIIIDALANREPYADDAKRIMEKCAARLNYRNHAAEGDFRRILVELRKAEKCRMEENRK